MKHGEHRPIALAQELPLPVYARINFFSFLTSASYIMGLSFRNSSYTGRVLKTVFPNANNDGGPLLTRLEFLKYHFPAVCISHPCLLSGPPGKTPSTTGYKTRGRSGLCVQHRCTAQPPIHCWPVEFSSCTRVFALHAGHR